MVRLRLNGDGEVLVGVEGVLSALLDQQREIRGRTITFDPLKETLPRYRRGFTSSKDLIKPLNIKNYELNYML